MGEDMLNLMQRICWNTRGWQFPSGSTHEKGFPEEYGFGHEEWNFQVSDVWNGFVFPYTYLTPQQKILDQNGGKFNIGFFTRHQERKKWLFLGIHHNAELIADDEYKEIIKSFKDNGVFERRADELFHATSKFKTRKAALKEVTDAFRVPYVRIKTPVANLEVFSQPVSIDKPANNRFKSFTYVDHFPYREFGSGDIEKPGSALVEDGYYRESASKLKIIIPKHNKLSNEFSAWLLGKGVSARQEENYIDILFEVDGVEYIAELKIVYGVGATKAIREAIGQLLEYNYYPGRMKKSEWMIVLDQQPSQSDREYMSSLIEERQLPLRLGWQVEGGFEFFPKWSNFR